MIYEIELKISKKDKELYESYLEDINNGYKDDFIQVNYGTFDNGMKIYIDLCSGDSNYYLQYELLDSKDNVVYYDTLEKDFEDFEIEDNENKYIIRFKEC